MIYFKNQVMYLIFISLVTFSLMCGVHGINYPVRCPQNEFFACGSACDTTCATLGQPCNIINKKCVDKCYCKEGYARDEYGKCIPIKDCPVKIPVCSALEKLFPCSPSCPPEQTCETYFQPVYYLCAQPLPNAPCIPRCKCIDGYIRNSKGACVKPEQCCNDPNAEVVGCPNPCPHTCNDTKSVCKEFCQLRGCQCKQGYILDKPNGKCIKFNECPKPLCEGPNEEYKNCKNPCPDTCESISSTKPQPQCSLPIPCPGGCDCLPGYVRNSNNICVRKEDCPKNCNQHEVYNPCPGYCTFDEDCGSYIYGFIRDCAAPPDDEVFPCYPRCDCEKGYLRINGTCQLPINCCEGPNTQIVDCPAACDKTCDGKDVANCEKNCFQKACRCIPGFVRDENGKCISQKQCPLKCKEHEVYNKCPRYCTFDEDCGSYIYGFIRDCAAPPPGPYPCYPRCDCEKGYVRIFGTCQLPIKCCDDVNAHVVNCPAECDKTCDGKDVADCYKNCFRRACRCLPGFVRDGNGKCITKNKCPPQCKPTEVWNPCPKYCTFDADCDSYLYGIIKDCTTTPAGGVPCKPRCECKPGLVRINGNCVSPDLCCNDPNAEVLDCPARCEKECFALPTDTTSCVDNCKGRVCRCKKGFLFDITKKCVAPENCIPKLNCKKNEVYNRCPKPCVPGKISYCSEYLTNTPQECVPVDNFKCEPRCDCIEGYLRNSKGECVNEHDCCDDPNAIAVKCPNPCPKTCDNYNFVSKAPCAKICKSIGCTCRDGFVLDAKGKCIKPAQCHE